MNLGIRITIEIRKGLVCNRLEKTDKIGTPTKIIHLLTLSEISSICSKKSVNNLVLTSNSFRFEGLSLLRSAKCVFALFLIVSSSISPKNGFDFIVFTKVFKISLFSGASNFGGFVPAGQIFIASCRIVAHLSNKETSFQD